MNLEQTEAKCLELLQSLRLFPLMGKGDFLIPEEILLTVIRLAHNEGTIEGAAAVQWIVDDVCATVRIAE